MNATASLKNQKNHTTLYKAMKMLSLIESGKFIGDCVLQSAGCMDLHIKNIGFWRDETGRSMDVLSLAHYYKQNGDAMRDPEVTFGINYEKGCVYPLTFRNDGLGVFQVTQDGGVNEGLELEIGLFLRQWLLNIKQQGFLDGLLKSNRVKELAESSQPF